MSRRTVGRHARTSLKVVRPLLLAFCLAGCGTLSRIEETTDRAADFTIGLPDGARRPLASAPQAIALAERVEARPPAERYSILALSGGGANGAFGAGVIAGWSRDDRPQFDIVTGVSTGALTAPFAFLGPEWDDELERAYTGGETRHLLGFRNFSAFVAPSLFSPHALNRLIDENISAQLLRDVAIEHAKGRRLLVVTTNLDAEQAVIWDMGVIATIGGERGLTLFRRVLLASASLPGVFPPVLLDSETTAGARRREMHVDGGVNLPFLGVPDLGGPEALPNTPAPGTQRRQVLYILVNGQISAPYRVTPGRMRDILVRSFDSWSNASLRAALAASAAYANRNGMDVFITAIPDDTDASSADFSTHSMRQLFQLGRRRAESSLVWSRVSAPRLLPSEPTETNAATPHPPHAEPATGAVQ